MEKDIQDQLIDYLKKQKDVVIAWCPPNRASIVTVVGSMDSDKLPSLQIRKKAKEEASGFLIRLGKHKRNRWYCL